MASATPLSTPHQASVAPWSPRFSAAARAVAAACRAMGLTAPGFRSPPAVAGVDRTLRRWPDGRCVVAVRAAGRDDEAVVADLVEGALTANRLRGAAADEARATLVQRLLADGLAVSASGADGRKEAMSRAG